MTTPFLDHRRVEFRDTDAAGIAHFSMFFVWMEQAEHAALRHVGLSVMDHHATPTISWPRVSATCDYHSPAFFEEQLTITVAIQRLGSKSVQYRFEFSSGERRIASGQLTTVCCEMDQGQKLSSIEIPPEVASKLRRLLNAA
jgi:4-hydroxybenzoyl-CoA thioesterase/acyl-CoA thioester hydrolase